MSCCGAKNRTKLDRTNSTRLALDLASIADASTPETVKFEACKTHTGSKKPVIVEDGEGIVRQHKLKAFKVDATLVTNARFAQFVLETEYVTVAEEFGWSSVFRGLVQDPSTVPPGGGTPWWSVIQGACWHAPEGAGSHIWDRLDHPVTHISWRDAVAFAQWQAGRLPSEAEWEHAARGGLQDPRFPWGEQEPDDTDFLPCNIFQGQFPIQNTAADGWTGTSPVKAFSPNNAGLYDMAGNVWEWTAEPYSIRSLSKAAKTRNAQARASDEKLMKGGSFLCHKSYCYRYRIAARLALAADSGACNSGFRVFYEA